VSDGVSVCSSEATNERVCSSVRCLLRSDMNHPAGVERGACRRRVSPFPTVRTAAGRRNPGLCRITGSAPGSLIMLKCA
jgi:hypothetical protein